MKILGGEVPKKIWIAAGMLLPFLGMVTFFLIQVPFRDASKIPGVSEVRSNAVMEQLTASLATWKTLSWAEKENAAERGISYFKTQKNTAFLNPPAFYADQLDRFLEQNPGSEALGILPLLQLIAVREYDFYNGEDKDALAKRVLGLEWYQRIRAQRDQVEGFLKRKND